MGLCVYDCRLVFMFVLFVHWPCERLRDLGDVRSWGLYFGFSRSERGVFLECRRWSFMV